MTHSKVDDGRKAKKEGHNNEERVEHFILKYVDSLAVSSSRYRSSSFASSSSLPNLAFLQSRGKYSRKAMASFGLLFTFRQIICLRLMSQNILYFIFMECRKQKIGE